jgi:hypothetical protein
LSLAVSGIAISAAYTSAQASKMNGKGSMCSEGSNCMSARYKSRDSQKASNGEAQNWKLRLLQGRLITFAEMLSWQ